MEHALQVGEPIREDWSIHIRSDGPEIVVEVSSEYVARAPNGDRHIVQGIPGLTSPLRHMQNIPLLLPDGHQTTWGEIVTAMRQDASGAIDHHISDLPEDRAEHRPADLHKKLKKHVRRQRALRAGMVALSDMRKQS